MNRRTFLKTTGIITCIGITTNIHAETKSYWVTPHLTPKSFRKTQWICAKDKLPEVGKEVIVKVIGGFRQLEIMIGKVSPAIGAAANEKNQGVYLTPEYSYVESREGTLLYEKGYIASMTITVNGECSCHFYYDKKERAKEDIRIERDKQEKLKRIENAEWLNKETKYDTWLGSYSRYIFDGDNAKVYWMLVNKEIPKQLPM